jgi:hypothetical protein
MLSVVNNPIRLSFVMLNFFILNVIMQIVVAPPLGATHNEVSPQAWAITFFTVVNNATPRVIIVTNPYSEVW